MITITIILAVLFLASDAFWGNLAGILIAATGLLAAGVAGFIKIFRMIRSLKTQVAKADAENKEKFIETHQKLNVVKDELDGKIDEYLDTVKELGKKEGVEQAHVMTDKEKIIALESKLETIQQIQKEAALLHTPPPTGS